MMRSYRGETIVLRTHKLGEADRIITPLTSEHGLVHAVAKGVRRTSPKFGSRVGPFGVVDVQTTKSRSLDITTQVEVISVHADVLASSFELYTCASAMVKTAKKLTQGSDEGARSQYLLLVGVLFALPHVRHDPSLILTSYILWALATAGWAPSCFDCAIHGTQSLHSSFSIHEGGAVYGQCRPAGAVAPAPETMALIGELLSGDWAHANAAEDFVKNETHALVSSYAQWHVERRIHSLRVLERSR